MLVKLFCVHMQMRDSFRPCYRGSCTSRVNSDIFAAAIKSLIEIMKMKETFEVIDDENSSTQWTMKHILNKVVEESCQWVRSTIH